MRANWEKLKEGSNLCDELKGLFTEDLCESREQGIIEDRIEGGTAGGVGGRIEDRSDITCYFFSCASRLVLDGGKSLEVYLGCSYIDFITISLIIGGIFSWTNTIEENVYKACEDWGVALVHGVSAAFTLSICF